MTDGNLSAATSEVKGIRDDAAFLVENEPARQRPESI
jgi:hypothetical protein